MADLKIRLGNITVLVAIIILLAGTSYCSAGSPPPNDNFTNALVITFPFYQIATSNFNATRETNEPDHGSPYPDSSGHSNDPGGEGNTSVWWSLTAPGDGYVDIIVSPATFTPLIAVYQGPAVSNLTGVTKNNEAFGVSGFGTEQDFIANNVRFNVLASSNYYIAVDGFAQSSGTFTFTSQFTAAPTNNYFVARTLLASNFTTVNGSNGGANLETNEPAHTGNTGSGSASVWWSWTPSQTGPVTLSTGGSSLDTILDVYTNSTLSTLSLVTNNDNEYLFPANPPAPNIDPASRVTFTGAARERPIKLPSRVLPTKPATPAPPAASCSIT